MVWVLGPITLGRIETIAGNSVATRFQMFNGVPLFPLGSVIEARYPSGWRDIPIPRVRRTVIAGYLSGWMPVLFFVSLIGAVVSRLWLLPGAIALVATLYLWFWYGRLSPAERRQRIAYATWTGAPVDPVWLAPEADYPFDAALRAFLDERAAVAPESYREKLGPGARWRAVAQDPATMDPHFLIAALTMARWESRKTTGAERASLDGLHEIVWAKLERLLATAAPPAFTEWEHFVRTREQPNRVHRYGWLAFALIGAIGAVAMYLDSGSRLVVANVSGEDGVVVLLDQRVIADRLPSAMADDERAVVQVRVSEGDHELVARDARGREIDRRRFVVAKGKHQLLYAPARAAETCFYEEIVIYSEHRHLQSYETLRLHTPEALHLFDERIDVWFGPPPMLVNVSQRLTEERRALRIAPCKRAAPAENRP